MPNAKLLELYNSTSKHSSYQVLPRALTRLLGAPALNVTIRRWEEERLRYILSKVNLTGQKVLDIGGNTGYFSFEALANDAQQVEYFEGNAKHAQFVEAAAEAIGMQNKIAIHPAYFDFFYPEGVLQSEVCLCLNVVHHLGDDFGDQSITMDEAKQLMVRSINSLAKVTKTLVFQLGFNWKGNRELPLFPNGTKEELIHFVSEGTKGYFNINYVGIAERNDGAIQYKDQNSTNLPRNNALGEFLNRPIFIMQSLK